MWALDQPCVARAEPLFAATPLTLLAVLALGAATTAALVELATLPPYALHVAGVTAGHGALFATALAWAGAPAASAGVVIALLGLAASAAGGGGVGALAYVGPALCIFWLARRGRLTALGLGVPVALRCLLAGALVGALLACHLLVSVSRTLGVHVRVDHLAEVLGAVAYDLGANVLAAECFFRGALFTRVQRRCSFPTAATLSTATYVLRYLIDPLLPQSVEFLVGAVFYLALLGAINCWLLWWSESLVPGLLSALLFFAAYRTLGAP